jgi:hypothetical protein
MMQAAMANPQAYPAVFRMLRLRQCARENPQFAEALRAIWGPVRQANEAIRVGTSQLLAPLKAVSAASAPLQAVMAAIGAEYQAQLTAIWADIRRVEKTEFAKLLDEIRQAEAQADKEWGAQFPCPRPKTTEDWQRLAVRAGIGADFVVRGEWTPADVLPIVEGYFQHLQDQESLGSGKASPPAGHAGSQQQSWANDAPEYLSLSEIRKLIDGQLSLQTLGRLCKPDGQIRFMRRGQRCKVHISDFRRCMQGRQSDPAWAAAYMNWLQGQKAGGKRLFWKCSNSACGHEYPEGANATDRCPNCKGQSRLTSKAPPSPTR